MFTLRCESFASFYKFKKNRTKNKYPTYFEEQVNFNAVLHNRNSVEGIYRFFKENYNKIPSIGELNDMGIRPDKAAEFWQTYQSQEESLQQSEHYQELEKDMFIQAPTYQTVCTFIHQYSDFVFKDYNELLYGKKENKHWITGTCVPFNKKMQLHYLSLTMSYMKKSQKNYCLLCTVFLLISTLTQAQKLSSYFVLQDKALSYLMEEKNEKAIYILKENCLKKYPQDLRSMFLLAYLYDQNKEFDSAYNYLVKMFQPNCGFFVRNITIYETDPLVTKYLDTSVSLKRLITLHYQKANKYKENQKIDSICQLLKKMLADDYLYRNDENRPIWDSLGLTDSIVFSKAIKVETININLLMSIIKEHGWPTYDMFGFEAAEAAFTIAQHADNSVNLQRECLKYIEKEFTSYKITPKDYAYLLDRVRVNLSKKQYFGTQFRKKKLLVSSENDSSSYDYEIYPLVHPQKVDIYRAICNLQLLEEYKAIHRKKYEDCGKEEQ